MGFFSGLTANGLLGAVGRMAGAGGRAFAPPSPASGPGGEDLLDRLRTAMDPERLAVAQALLAGDHEGASRMTEPFRRQRLAAREARLAPARGARELEEMRAAGAAGPGGHAMGRRSLAAHPYQAGSVPEHLRAPNVPLTSDLIVQDRPDRASGPGSWQFDTLDELEAAYDDMATREELEEIGRRGGVVNERWLGDLDNALARRHADPGMAIPFRNFVPESAQGGDAVVREPEAIRANRARYRAALRAQREGLAYGVPTGRLADQRETGGRGMRTISSGADDPGGVSVGRFQLNDFMRRQFLAADEGEPWRNELQNLDERSPAFRAAWDRIVDREGAQFERAQYRFLYRENYTPPAAAARRSAEFDLSAAHPILQEVVWSMSNNVGGPDAPGILIAAIERADRQHRRGDPRHEEAVIREVYSGWIDRLAEREQRNRRSNPGTARTFRNMATATVPAERDVALEAYRR